MKRIFLLVFLSTTLLWGENRQQIAYLMRSRQVANSIDLYKKTQKELGRHDFEILEQLGAILLEEGAHSEDQEKRLLSILGLGYAGVSSSVDILNILERGIKASSPEAQMLSIQFLGQLQDDRTEELLTKAMSSDFLITRLEAAFQLSSRKERSALGQIESLMHKLPPFFRFYFPEFFARIGTTEAMGTLRQMIDDPNTQVRISAILSSASYQRDDLIAKIRLKAKHGNEAEKEASLSALGHLNDANSLPLLKKMAASPTQNISLAALRSLYLLADTSAKQQIIEKAKAKNVLAIAMLADISETADVLAELVNDDNIQVRFNAGVSLLRHKDSRCQKVLNEILIRDSRDLGFQPYFSTGASLSALKVVPSAQQHQKKEMYDLIAMSLNFRDQVLKEAIELPEEDFLKIAKSIFYSSQTNLIPVLISLLENLQTPQALALLKEQTQRAGSPLIRAYCNLALFRLRQEGPYELRLYEWLSNKKKDEMIRFRPLAARQPNRKESNFELTPEENSRLLIESYAALAERHDSKSIDALLLALKEGSPKNRPLIAGLLLRAIQ